MVCSPQASLVLEFPPVQHLKQADVVEWPAGLKSVAVVLLFPFFLPQLSLPLLRLLHHLHFLRSAAAGELVPA